MVKRKVFTVGACVVCQEPFEQAARGRPRLTCSDACKQARYRLHQGKPSRKIKRLGKIVAKRRSKPFIERQFDKDWFEPVRTLSYRRWVYECMACGKPYLFERVTRGNMKVRLYCSDACEQKANRHWEKFEDALAKASMSGRQIDPRVWERLDYKKLSPLCPRCGTPFAPNTNLYGERRGGRPRKYCSDRCRYEAYEQRWKNKNRRSRVHRNHECAECGTMFDRTDISGKRRKRYCSESCRERFKKRAVYARMKASKEGKTITGRRAATLGAKKNKIKRAISNENGREALGGEGLKEQQKNGLSTS